jgi:alpha-1,2-mannosyltransferase
VSQLDVPLAPPPAPSAVRPRLRLRLWELGGLSAMAATFLIFAVVTEWRSVYLSRPMTDVQVYLRAAWAARTGADIYTIEDANHWHYHYPPLLAILTMPLADAPPGADHSGLLPFGVSVAVWYWLSVAFLVAGINSLASAVEPNTIRFSRRWWALRFWPLLFCLPPTLATLVRGQINVIVLALICFAGAAELRGRRWRSGLWIAAAVCLKVIPALLLLYPLRRRDYRCLGGCALGLLLGLIVIPAAWFGPARTATYVIEWNNALLRPALGGGSDHARDIELILATSTDSQSPVAMIHNALHLDRLSRPYVASAQVRLAHWLIGGLLLGVTLLAAGPNDGGHRLRPLLFLGALSLVMLLLSPVCHLHYFCLALPLVMGLIAWEWQTRGSRRLSRGLLVVLVLHCAINAMTHFPGMDLIRDLCLAGYATMLLWLAAVVVLWRTRPATQARNASEDLSLAGVSGLCGGTATP